MGFGSPIELSDESGFTLPSYARGLVATHVLELPYNLRLPDEGFRLFSTEDVRSAPAIDPELALMVLGLPPNLEFGDRVPVTRLFIRRTKVRIQMPLQAADLTFGEWKRTLLPRRAWKRRLRDLRRAVKRGITGPVTVVAASRLIAANDWPTGRAAQDARLDGELDYALEFLNDFLLALGLLTGDLGVRPIARGDLPPASPVLLDAFPMNEGCRVGAGFLRKIHDNLPAFAYPTPYPKQVAELAAQAAVLHRTGYDPFALFYEFIHLYEFIHRSRASLAEYRPSEAVIAAATAVEVLVNVTIREVGPLLGISATKVAGHLDAPFASRFREVLPTYLAFPATAPPAELDAWFNGGYRLRHDVVHRGERANMVDAERAVSQASAIGLVFRNALRSQSATRDLSERLQWGESSEKIDWEHEEPLAEGELGVFTPPDPRISES